MDKLKQYTLEIVEFKRNVGQNMWLIGNRLLEIKETKIYLEKYGLWSEYLLSEVDISERSAERFMRIAKDYTEKLVVEWGAHKLDLLASLEEAQQQEFIQVHSPLESTRDIQREVQQIKVQRPEGSVETDYFFKTELVLREAWEKIQEAAVHITTCRTKPDFETYPRQRVIEGTWGLITQEVNKHGYQE